MSSASLPLLKRPTNLKLIRLDNDQLNSNLLNNNLLNSNQINNNQINNNQINNNQINNYQINNNLLQSECINNSSDEEIELINLDTLYNNTNITLPDYDIEYNNCNTLEKSIDFINNWFNNYNINNRKAIRLLNLNIPFNNKEEVDEINAFKNLEKSIPVLVLSEVEKNNLYNVIDKLKKYSDIEKPKTPIKSNELESSINKKQSTKITGKKLILSDNEKDTSVVKRLSDINSQKSSIKSINEKLLSPVKIIKEIQSPIKIYEKFQSPIKSFDNIKIPLKFTETIKSPIKTIDDLSIVNVTIKSKSVAVSDINTMVTPLKRKMSDTELISAVYDELLPTGAVKNLDILDENIIDSTGEELEDDSNPLNTNSGIEDTVIVAPKLLKRKHYGYSDHLLNYNKSAANKNTNDTNSTTSEPVEAMDVDEEFSDQDIAQNASLKINSTVQIIDTIESISDSEVESSSESEDDCPIPPHDPILFLSPISSGPKLFIQHNDFMSLYKCHLIAKFPSVGWLEKNPGYIIKYPYKDVSKASSFYKSGILFEVSDVLENNLYNKFLSSSRNTFIPNFIDSGWLSSNKTDLIWNNDSNVITASVPIKVLLRNGSERIELKVEMSVDNQITPLIALSTLTELTTPQIKLSSTFQVDCSPNRVLCKPIVKKFLYWSEKAFRFNLDTTHDNPDIKSNLDCFADDSLCGLMFPCNMIAFIPSQTNYLAFAMFSKGESNSTETIINIKMDIYFVSLVPLLSNVIYDYYSVVNYSKKSFRLRCVIDMDSCFLRDVNGRIDFREGFLDFLRNLMPYYDIDLCTSGHDLYSRNLQSLINKSYLKQFPEINEYHEIKVHSILLSNSTSINYAYKDLKMIYSFAHWNQLKNMIVIVDDNPCSWNLSNSKDGVYFFEPYRSTPEIDSVILKTCETNLIELYKQYVIEVESKPKSTSFQDNLFNTSTYSALLKLVSKNSLSEFDVNGKKCFRSKFN